MIPRDKQHSAVLLFSRCVKTEWRAVEMASSVDRIVLNANW